MNFLNGGLLAALAPLLALPLLIHLFNRRFPNTIPFPDIERIRRSISERSRLAKWRHWLMTLLRTLLIACALFAFLKPVVPEFGSESGSGESRRVLILLDRSMSLLHRQGANASAAKRAEVEVGKILDTMKPGDVANVVLADQTPSPLLPEFTSSTERIRTSLAALDPGYEKQDVNRALSLATRILEGNEAGSEIYVLSDFQRSNWANSAFDGLPQSTRLFFVDLTGGAERDNRAILSLDLSTPNPTPEEVVTLTAEIANWTSEPALIPVEAIIDNRISVAGEISLAADSTGRVDLDFVAPGDGLHTLEARIPEDSLAVDDVRHATFEVKAREDVLVISDSDPVENGARFLTTALNPFEKGGAFSPRILRGDDLTPARLSSVSRVVVTGSSLIDAEMATRLVSFLEYGGGLLYFTNGKHDDHNLSELERAFGRPFAPYQIAGTLELENFGGRPQQIARGEFDSRFLELFRGENRQILSVLEFYQIKRAFATEEGRIVLTYADGTPAMGVTHVGLGTAVFCNFNPAELSSNIARQRLFPAWIQELVRHLTPETLPDRTFPVGSTLSAEVWRSDFEQGRLLDPNGEQITPRATGEGQQVLATFEAPLPGVYRLEDGGRMLWVEAANPFPEESNLARIEIENLKSRATGSTRGAHQVDGAADYESITNGRPLFHWFLLAVAALLLVEMMLQRTFQRATGT